MGDVYWNILVIVYIQGFNSTKEYIASQGPKDNTVNDFWQMIWEQNTPAIAVIGSPVENGRVSHS